MSGKDEKANLQLLVEYRRLRSLDWPAVHAITAARIDVLFSELCQQGLARFRVECDSEPFDDSFLDTWGLAPSALDRERAQLWERIEREGVWGIKVEIVCPHCGNWESVDAVWGFVGEDWQDSGYDVDLKRQAVYALHSEQSSELN